MQTVAERKTLTWGDLLAAEPALAQLEAECRGAKRLARGAKRWCANAFWYGYPGSGYPGIKPRLLYLVGWEARNKALRTVAAYDFAYHHLYDLLPDCRECMCF